MNKLLIWISLFTFPSLACGMQTSGAKSQSILTVSESPAQVNFTLQMVVTAEALNIREGASEHTPADLQGLEQGEPVTVFLSCTGGELRDWAAIDADCTRWVRSAYLEPVLEAK